MDKVIEWVRKILQLLRKNSPFENGIPGREKVRLNYWEPLDFMARYRVSHFPGMSC